MIRSLVRSLIDAIVGALVPTDTPYVATERLVNRGFVNSTSWTIEATSWTIAAGKATSGTGDGLSQSFSLVNSGVAVAFAADVTNINDVVLEVLLQMDGITVQTIYNTDPVAGLLSVTAVAQAEFNGIKFKASGATGLTLDNVSLIA